MGEFFGRKPLLVIYFHLNKAHSFPPNTALQIQIVDSGHGNIFSINERRGILLFKTEKLAASSENQDGRESKSKNSQQQLLM